MPPDRSVQHFCSALAKQAGQSIHAALVVIVTNVGRKRKERPPTRGLSRFAAQQQTVGRQQLREFEVNLSALPPTRFGSINSVNAPAAKQACAMSGRIAAFHFSQPEVRKTLPTRRESLKKTQIGLSGRLIPREHWDKLADFDADRET